MELFEETIKSESIWKGKIFEVKKDEVRLPDNSTAQRDTVHLSHRSVAIFAKDDCGFVYFVRQFRYPYKEVLLELPAGKANEGETPTACALRELKEETGQSANKIEVLTEMYPSPGFCDEVLYLCLATELTAGEQCLDEDEFLNVEKIPFDKALSMVKSGEIKDAKTALAMLLMKERERE